MLNSLETVWSRKLLDVLIQAGLIGALVVLCFQIFSPFLTLMLWAVILAVTLYPLHQIIARKLGGRQGWAATLLVLSGILLIVVPIFLLASSLADSIVSFLQGMRDNTLVIPPPPDAVAGWPIVGKKLHAAWQLAATDLPALLQKLQPKIGDLARAALGYVASMGGSMLAFLFSFVVAGIIMAYGEGGAESMRAISRRIIGAERGDRFAVLSTHRPCRRDGSPRRGLDPGHRDWSRIDTCRDPVCGGAGGHHSGAGGCPDSGAPDYAAGHRLHLDERQLRDDAGCDLYRAAGDCRFR